MNRMAVEIEQGVDRDLRPAKDLLDDRPRYQREYRRKVARSSRRCPDWRFPVEA
jgi:hypothetical protein